MPDLPALSIFFLVWSKFNAQRRFHPPEKSQMGQNSSCTATFRSNICFARRQRPPTTAHISFGFSTSLVLLPLFHALHSPPPPLHHCTPGMTSGPSALYRNILFLIAFLTLISEWTLAQTPPPACCMSFTTVDEKTLFIHSAGTAYDLYSLDLTKSWSATSAPWTQLPNSSSPDDSERHPMVYSAGSRMLEVYYDKIGTAQAMTYSLDTKTWTILSLPTGVFELGFINTAAKDTTSGKVYFPSVRRDNKMVVYDPVAKTWTVTGATHVADGALGTLYYPTSVWLKTTQTVLLFGGAMALAPYLQEYSPSTGTWSMVVSSIIFFRLPCSHHRDKQLVSI